MLVEGASASPALGGWVQVGGLAYECGTAGVVALVVGLLRPAHGSAERRNFEQLQQDDDCEHSEEAVRE